MLLVAKRRLGIQQLWIYILAGLFMWLCVLKSGVHATVAGVIIGLLLPLNGVNGKQSPADSVEHALQPWVRWLVLPLFAFANVGVDFTGLGLESLFSILTWGIALGLLFGKQAGVFGTVWIIQKAGILRPAGSSWLQVYGVACMCGIGFTMSLFIGALAFQWRCSLRCASASSWAASCPPSWRSLFCAMEFRGQMKQCSKMCSLPARNRRRDNLVMLAIAVVATMGALAWASVPLPLLTVAGLGMAALALNVFLLKG